MEENDDDGLAPMVDGLSGALCVLILITTVFMLSATDTIISGASGFGFKFNYSTIQLEQRKLEFNGGINLSHQDLYSIREDLRTIANPVMYIYMPEDIRSRRQKMVFNISDLKKKLNLEKPLQIKAGEGSVCGILNSCVYWGEK